MKLVIPLAGTDPRFPHPKCLTVIDGSLLFSRVMKQHDLSRYSEIVLITRRDIEKQYGLFDQIRKYCGAHTRCVTIPEQTNGAPQTIINASPSFDPDEDIIVELADVERDLRLLYAKISQRDDLTAGIIPIQADTLITKRPWGYVDMSESGVVTGLHEKILPPVGSNATMGLYYFSNGKEFIAMAESMIRKKQDTYHSMSYVGPVYNQYIERGRKIVAVEIPIITIFS